MSDNRCPTPLRVMSGVLSAPTLAQRLDTYELFLQIKAAAEAATRTGARTAPRGERGTSAVVRRCPQTKASGERFLGAYIQLVGQIGEPSENGEIQRGVARLPGQIRGPAVPVAVKLMPLINAAEKKDVEGKPNFFTTSPEAAATAVSEDSGPHSWKAWEYQSWAEVTVAEAMRVLLIQRRCPNLAFLYEYSYCDHCLYAVAKLGETTSKCLHLVSELASGSLTGWLAKAKRSLLEVRSVCYQILVALLAMDWFFDADHGDLHPGNILMLGDMNPRPASKGAEGYWLYARPSFDTKASSPRDSEHLLARFDAVPSCGVVACLHDFQKTLVPGLIEPKHTQRSERRILQAHLPRGRVDYTRIFVGCFWEVDARGQRLAPDVREFIEQIERAAASAVPLQRVLDVLFPDWAIDPATAAQLTAQNHFIEVYRMDLPIDTSDQAGRALCSTGLIVSGRSDNPMCERAIQVPPESRAILGITSIDQLPLTEPFRCGDESPSPMAGAAAPSLRDTRAMRRAERNLDMRSAEADRFYRTSVPLDQVGELLGETSLRPSMSQEPRGEPSVTTRRRSQSTAASRSRSRSRSRTRSGSRTRSRSRTRSPVAAVRSFTEGGAAIGRSGGQVRGQRPSVAALGSRRAVAGPVALAAAAYQGSVPGSMGPGTSLTRAGLLSQTLGGAMPFVSAQFMPRLAGSRALYENPGARFGSQSR